MYYDSAEVFFLLIGLICYLGFFFVVHLLYAFGPYRMAKHAGIPHAWVGLFPLGTAWITGLLAERSLYTYTGKRRRLAFWTTVLYGIGFCGLIMLCVLIVQDADFSAWVGLSFFLTLVGYTAACVLSIYCTYYTLKDYSPDNALLYTLLGVFFQISFVFLLIEMNTVPVSVTGPGSFPYGRPKYNGNHQWSPVPPQGYGYPQGGQGQPGGPYPYTTNPGQQGGPGAPYPYTTNPGQQGGPGAPYPYTTNPGQPPQQPPYTGQGPWFYQGAPGPYQAPPPGQPFDPSRNFPGGGYDPKNPDTFPPPGGPTDGQGPQFYQGGGYYQNPPQPPERPRDEGPGNGPEL